MLNIIKLVKVFEGHDSFSEAPCQTTQYQPMCEARQWRLFSDSTSPRILLELRETCCCVNFCRATHILELATKEESPSWMRLSSMQSVSHRHKTYKAK
ncbi:hypothetical protein AVEN_124414-1 [Araneus ventricosus]|uniref:Uncharacterized protein n=1 Tax=Araneus ventricosus TaxID=182803 RepID=A0A4Y2X1E6_ARAVE|nr:hypothetical protein AVEN_124414-1 [Araneus ventricosus]